MLVLLIALLCLGVVAAAFGIYIGRRNNGQAPEIHEASPADCCGQHAVCEKESLLAAVSRDIEYYDDEELDRYAGRPDDQYTDDEAEEFDNIFGTMRAEDVAGWIRSLQLRGIALPLQLRDDVLLVVEELRAK